MGHDFDLLYVGVAVVAFIGLVLVLARPAGLFSGGGGRLPRSFVVEDLKAQSLAPGAQRPLEFLATKLASLGFSPADLPVQVPTVRGIGHSLVLVPFVHVEESAFFIMGIEQHLLPRPELMLHIITPLTGGRRVETSTLPILETLVHPPETQVAVVLDAESVEEIWSRHRRALSKYERSERAPILAEQWRQYAAAAYEAWLLSGVRAQRLQLASDGETYRVKDRPKSII